MTAAASFTAELCVGAVQVVFLASKMGSCGDGRTGGGLVRGSALHAMMQRQALAVSPACWDGIKSREQLLLRVHICEGM